ncbi:MAG: S1 family peptidase [Rhodospirillales bacterium]
MIEPLLLTTTRITTFDDQRSLTNATGFFFRQGGRLFLVTSLHVVQDKASSHFPNRIEIEIHTDPSNLALATDFSISLLKQGKPVWRGTTDRAGVVDVAVIEINQADLPADAFFCAFEASQIPDIETSVEIGANALVVGFPLGFHDTLHHLPVVRHAIVASTIGLRFQGNGYFLTDARTHRGSSGAPVVTKVDASVSGNDLSSWLLLGVHSSRLDIGTRDMQIDEALGLNCTWYADVLLTLTGP